jgi:putative ABC transport system ATP-binding protein
MSVAPSLVPVQLTEVQKVYGSGPGAVTALGGVSYSFAQGTCTAVMGPSGSGKSTLLHCAAGLDEPSSGEVHLAGTPLRSLNETELTELRREHVAFVFQAFNLMPALTVRQNIVLPQTLAGQTPDDAWVSEVIRRVGLSERTKRPPERTVGRSATAGRDRPGPGRLNRDHRRHWPSSPVAIHP